MDTTGSHRTPDSLRHAAGFVVRRLYQAYTAAWARRVDPVLTGPQFAVLTAVETYPDADQGSLAASVSLDRSTMADVCRRLEERGLISRDTAPGDGRRKLLRLTASGAVVVAETGDRVKRLNDELMGSGAEAEALLARLDELSARWENAAAADPYP